MFLLFILKQCSDFQTDWIDIIKFKYISIQRSLDNSYFVDVLKLKQIQKWIITCQSGDRGRHHRLGIKCPNYKNFAIISNFIKVSNLNENMEIHNFIGKLVKLNLTYVISQTVDTNAKKLTYKNLIALYQLNYT